MKDTLWGIPPESPDGDANMTLARVTTVQKGQCRIVTAETPPGEEGPWAQVSGRFEFVAQSPADYPAVGDWVYVRGDGAGTAVIERVADRKSLLSRKAAGSGGEEQVIAANVDLALVVTALSDGDRADFNVRRLERYLALARAGGVRPLVILTKADTVGGLGDGTAPFEARAREVAGDALVLPVSSVTGAGIDAVEGHLSPGITLALLGSSGVGKSTLLNRLMGEMVAATQEVREADDRGRHTTTARTLFRLPGGALVIDTPGMRELGLFDADDGVDEGFADVVDLAAACRFNDCTHGGEPGCAVQEAIDAGDLDPGRLVSYMKLKREHAWAKAREDKAALANRKKRWKSINKQMRKHKGKKDWERM